MKSCSLKRGEVDPNGGYDSFACRIVMSAYSSNGHWRCCCHLWRSLRECFRFLVYFAEDFKTPQPEGYKVRSAQAMKLMMELFACVRNGTDRFPWRKKAF